MALEKNIYGVTLFHYARVLRGPVTLPAFSTKCDDWYTNSGIRLPGLNNLLLKEGCHTAYALNWANNNVSFSLFRFSTKVG